jgi:rhamnosyltransferase
LKYKVLVIIPIFNPNDTLFSTIIPILLKQSIKPNILLISSGAKVPVGNYESIVIDKKDFNHANTRNIALLHVSDFYLFMTQDATPFDEYLIENLLKSFDDEDVVVSYARQIHYEGAHITERFARERNYPNISTVKSRDDIQTLGIKTFFTSDSCALYNANYFKKQSGFTKDLNTSEDMEFAARAIWDNKKIAYCAEAKVYHSHNYTFLSLLKRYIEIGKFFKQNEWLQKSIPSTISTEKVGYKQVKEELFYIASQKPLSLIKSLFFIVIKYIGYNVGKYI